MKNILFSLLGLMWCMQSTAQTKVYLIPTVHGMHASNPRYNYDSLQSLIRRINPDVIAIEIRSEDLGSDSNYLKSNYPLEMRMASTWFRDKKVEGFDWLGSDLEGRPVPSRYWKDSSRVKALEALMKMDTVYQKRLAKCRIYSEGRMKTLQSGSLKQILATDAMLTQEYYNCLRQTLRGSDYEALTDFYSLRNHKIQENLLALVTKYPDNTIVVLTGADHYPYLRSYLQKQSLRLLQPF